MPASLPDAELEQIIEQTLRAGNFTQKDFGKAMKEVMAQVAGLPSRPDGGRVSAILKAKLAGHG